MRKMWRNRETNKNEILAGLCLLFAIGGIMLAGFGTKTDDVTTVIFGDETRHLTDELENVEYSEREKIPLMQGKQEQTAQEEQGQTTQEEQRPTAREDQEQTTSQEQEQAVRQEQTAWSEEKDTSDITVVMERTVVVQPGDSLWKIAEGCLGDGSQYIAIYEQNRDLIGDDPRFILAGIELNLSGLESAE